MVWVQLVGLILGAYLIGAIPNGFLLGRLHGQNLLQQGSGKTGATNTMHVLGRRAAAVVFLLDLVKGALAVLLARALPWPDPQWRDLAVGAAAAAAIAGHNWSLWVRLLAGRWGGGRGLVTALGAALLIHPLAGLVALVGAALGFGLAHDTLIGGMLGTLAGLGTIVVLAATGVVSAWVVPGAVLWALLIMAGFHDSFRRALQGRQDPHGRLPD
ncbi:MAG TPA: glycerol-3-phosphate acyltransferase [Chloroflexia bacterium]|nr:glycerol-3-phosphate acyltransferase [Chloroflexia bacterium]